jgi:hypothetical protein
MLFWTNSACTPKPEIVIVGDPNVIGKLENGNIEVTPLFIVEQRILKDEIEMLKKQIEILKATIKKLQDTN